VSAHTQDILTREKVPPATHLWILFVLWAVCIGSALIKVRTTKGPYRVWPISPTRHGAHCFARSLGALSRMRTPGSPTKL
jgi:hypothetical protein